MAGDSIAPLRETPPEKTSLFLVDPVCTSFANGMTSAERFYEYALDKISKRECSASYVVKYRDVCCTNDYQVSPTIVYQA